MWQTIQTIVSAAALLVGLPGIITLVISHMLNRKGANKKLDLDDQTVENDTFRAQKDAFVVLDAAQTARYTQLAADFQALREEVSRDRQEFQAERKRQHEIQGQMIQHMALLESQIPTPPGPPPRPFWEY